MAKLTTTQIAIEVGVSVYTINRWYKWWNTEDVNKLNELVKNGMPSLPKYETIGTTNWKYWEKKDIEQLKAFKAWMPHTKNGIMGSLNKKEDK